VSGVLLGAARFELLVFVGAAAGFSIRVYATAFLITGPVQLTATVLNVGLLLAWGPVGLLGLSLGRLGRGRSQSLDWGPGVVLFVAVCLLGRLALTSGPTASPAWMWDTVRAHPPAVFSMLGWLGLIAAVWLLVASLWRGNWKAQLAIFLTVALTLTTLGLWLSMGEAARLGLRDFSPKAIPQPEWLVAPLVAAGTLFLVTTFLLVVRYTFTFFTTVSIGGVAIGGMALVIVLSVMGGFEDHLRSRILGSNAHVLIKRSDEARFANYAAIRARIVGVPGVLDSTPFLQTEVVIAANQNYGSTLVKGVDPETVARVTDFESSVKDPNGLAKLWPLSRDGEVQGAPAPLEEDGLEPGRDGPSIDPAPIDMGLPDDGPRDFAAPHEPTEPPQTAGEPDTADPAPADMELPADDGPEDFSGLPTKVPETGYAVRPGGPLPGIRDVVLPEVAVLSGVLVGRELARNVNLYEGLEVRLVSPLGQDTPVGQVPRQKRMRVAGVFYTGMYQYDLKLIYAELGALQDFLDVGDVVDGIEIRVLDPRRTAPVIAGLKERLGTDYSVKDWKAINRSLFSALQLEKRAMFIVLVITILVASFSIMGNLIMTVYERGREIAVLKTLGAAPGGILKVFVIQGFGIGLVGTLGGVGMGLALCLLNAVKPYPLDPDVYYMDGLPTQVDPSAVVAIAAAGIVISVLATIYPAYVAARMEVVRGLRSD